MKDFDKDDQNQTKDKTITPRAASTRFPRTSVRLPKPPPLPLPDR